MGKAIKADSNFLERDLSHKNLKCAQSNGSYRVFFMWYCLNYSVYGTCLTRWFYYLCFWINPYCVTIQMKAFKQYFHVLWYVFNILTN